MARLFIVVVLLGVFIGAVGLVVLGAFPPEPHTHQIQKARKARIMRRQSGWSQFLQTICLLMQISQISKGVR